jgi:DNA-binding Xre family transcriptional regulator
MSELSAVVSALKQALKARGLRYADLAQALGLSEASIKRCFSRNTLTLSRLEKICAVLDLDLFDLMRLSRRADEEPRQLTLEQERALAADAQMLSLFHLIASGWTFTEIRAEFDINERTLSRQLARLDRLRLIELGAGNRVRLRVPARFTWRNNGPVKRLHSRAATGEFLTGDFAGRDELCRLEVKELSETSLAQVRRKLERLASEFNQLAEFDAALPAAKRRSVGMVLAIKPWVFSLLGALRRKNVPRGA